MQTTSGRRVQSSATTTTRRPRRTQQEPPFEHYFDRLMEEMRNQSQSQNPTSKNDEFLNLSDPDVMYLRMLLSVIREVPAEKRTEVRGDIYTYLTYIISACKERRPYPCSQPWGLGFNTPSGSFNKPLPSQQYHENTPAVNPYAGPPPMYTPFASHSALQRLHFQPQQGSSPSSSHSSSTVDVGSEPSHSSQHPYPVYENL